jgi:hypothetical protein
VDLARNRSGIVAGERYPQRVRARRGGAGGEHAFERLALRGETPLRLAPPLADAPCGRAQRALLGCQAREAAVRLRDRAFRVAQRIARLAPRAFLLLELRRDRVDAVAQLRQLFFAGIRLRAAGGERNGQAEQPDQTFALPCAATAAMRFSISAGSPR